jgi:hypothetical protein
MTFLGGYSFCPRTSLSDALSIFVSSYFRFSTREELLNHALLSGPGDNAIFS